MTTSVQVQSSISLTSGTAATSENMRVEEEEEDEAAISQEEHVSFDTNSGQCDCV